MNRARVGLDVRCTRQMSAGMQRYARELAARLPRVAPELEFVRFDRGGNFGWSEQVALPLAIARSRVRLVHFTSQYVPLVVPAPSAITIHDLIHLRFPEQFKARVGPYYRTIVRRACARAARVITDDERTVEDLQRFLGVDPRKVRVVPLGVNAATAQRERSREAGARAYFLNVGNHRTHKSLQTLVDAWQSLPEKYDVDLFFTGSDDFDGALQRASTERRRARALGVLSEEELDGYYRGATALVHPALREGFGLPMLEAMAAGTPVVASAEAVPSVLVQGTLTFPAGDARALAARLVETLEDEGLRGRLVNEGLMLAERLTWDRCARETAAVYHEIVG